MLLESIKVSDGLVYNLPYHQARMNRSIRELYNTSNPHNLIELFTSIECQEAGLYKWRIVYDHLSINYTLDPYSLQSITSLKLVYDNTIDYHHKWLDRSRLDYLYSLRGACDDILIVKNNLITDSYYCNVAFLRDGNWYTPSEPLLPGTKRQQLLDEGVIIEANISVEDLKDYEAVRLFNGMVEFGAVEVVRII